MITDITIGQMYPANSPIHKMDARFKLIITVLFVVMLFWAKSAVGMAINLVFVFGGYLISSIPFKMLFKTVKPVIPIVVFMMAFNIFFYGGKTVLVQFWILKITREGIFTTLFMIYRVLCIIAGTALLTYTTSSIELTDALESLFSPLKAIKFPVSELAMMMTIALRFIPTLIEETDRIMSAQKARGADFESGNIISRCKALLPILIPLFISAIKRATELATAMESRCYKNGEGRTRMKQLKSAPRDYVALSVTLAMLAATIAADFLVPRLI